MATTAAAPASTGPPVDALQYAEQLRKTLMQDLFDGDEAVDPLDDDDGDFSIEVPSGTHLSLGDLDKQIEEYQEHEIIRAILDKGMVIKEYATDIDNKLRQVELESIQDYIQESDNLVGLHEQIKNCDAILSHMEQMLGRFQGDLGKVSEEIRQLQVQSQTMSMKLKNRRAAEGKLGNFVNQVTVPEDLVTNIFEAEVSEDYLEYLLTLDRKLRFISDDETARVSSARRDVEPALEKLRVKAITRVREFLLQKIYTLKRPKTNIQIIQQNVLLKYKYFIRFLRQHGKEIYDEVRSEYVSVLGKIYASHFRSYLSSMERMQQAVASQTDVIGLADAPTGVNNVLSLFGKTQARAASEAVFELGDRAGILGHVKDMPMIPHMAEYEGKKFPYEVIFRNIHKLLLDTATSEFFFCLDFFEDEGVFRDVCQPIIAIVEGDLATATHEQVDLLGICLMIRLNHEHRRMMVKRKVPVLDDYLDRINLMLWPRFKVLLDSQMSSIRAGAEQRLYNGEVAVHSVARRYAALCSSLLLLMNEHEQEDAGGAFQASSFHDQMDRLWAAMFDLLLRMSNMYKDRRQGIIFLILNYNHIHTVLKGTDVSAEKGQPAAAAAATATSPRSPSASGGGLGSHGANAIKGCRDQLSSCTQLYVEDQLAAHFPALVEYVKKAEQQNKRMAVPEGAPIPGYGPAEATPVLADFSARWTAAIEAMAKEVVRGFPDAVCGREVLQASMTQLLLYYSRALELLKKQGAAGQAVAKDAVNIPSIMYEIKRITKT